MRAEALQDGKILPLRDVLDRVERDYPGQVVKVEFEEDDGEFIYEIRLLQSGGGLIKMKIDARDGKVLGVKGATIPGQTLMRILVVEDEPRCRRSCPRRWASGGLSGGQRGGRRTTWARSKPMTWWCWTWGCR